VKKFIVIIIVIVASAAGLLVYKYNRESRNQEKYRLVPVKRGRIIVKALAIGQINPKQEVEVKSKIRGIVKNKYVEVGDSVAKGDPLMEVDPDPTPQEYSRAKRQMELARIAMDNAEKEYKRYEQLRDKQWVSQQELEDYKEIYDDKELRFKLAQEDFDLISKGKIDVYGKAIDNIIKSPIDGTVLDVLVDEGDPVVPLTSSQPGTPLLTVANMKELIFEGTVDEIDIGKIREGISANLKAGAIPDEVIVGYVSEIAPKANREGNTTLFDIEIAITNANPDKLRAGYSVNAEIIIDKAENVLVVPERLIIYSNETTYVEISHHSEQETIEMREISVSLSDGMNTRVESGLKENEMVVERPPKELK
jgi:HlyD family secretion protein